MILIEKKLVPKIFSVLFIIASIPGELSLWKVNDRETYIQKVSATEWQEIQNQNIAYYFTLTSQTNDVVEIVDKTRNINLKLSSVDCRYIETNKVLYFGSWLSTFVKAISIYFKATAILSLYNLL